MIAGPDVVTVFASSNNADVITAKLLLEAERIPFEVDGELVQDMFALGRTFGPFNALVGPVQIRVAAEHAERALESLSELRGTPSD